MITRLIGALTLIGVVKYGRNVAIAEKTGYSKAAVAGIMSGQKPITSRFITAVCAAFCIRREWIEEGKEPIFESKTMMRILDTSHQNKALHWANHDMEHFLLNNVKIMGDEIKYLFRDIALLVQILPDEDFDPDLIRSAKQAANEVLAIFKAARQADV
jgi:hypothetical protein